jgi:hypothetical protein
MISGHGYRALLPALLAGIAILASCGPAGDPAAHAIATPTPKPFDFSAWTISTIGTGPTATGAGTGVDFMIPGNSHGDPGQAQKIEIRLQANCTLTADFDVQVDYSIIAWPTLNGVHFGLVAGGDSAERASNPNGSDNEYASYLSGHVTTTDTTDTTGRLRLTRVGTTITSYYQRGQTWVQIASSTGPATPLPFLIAAWTDTYMFDHRDVRVNLKNVTATGCS